MIDRPTPGRRDSDSDPMTASATVTHLHSKADDAPSNDGRDSEWNAIVRGKRVDDEQQRNDEAPAPNACGAAQRKHYKEHQNQHGVLPLDWKQAFMGASCAY